MTQVKPKRNEPQRKARTARREKVTTKRPAVKEKQRRKAAKKMARGRK